MWKIIAWSIPIGAAAGAITAVFGHMLLFITKIRDSAPMHFLPFLALAGAAMVWAYETWGGESKEGMGLVFSVGHGEKQRIPTRLIPLIMVSTWLTHLFGGSAGREGVAVQIGAAVSNRMSRNNSEAGAARIYLMVGMAAGFAGLFQTPLAAAAFAVEVLLVGRLAVGALLPALTASFAAYGVSSFLRLEKFTVEILELPDISPAMWGKLLLLGILFGMTGTFFAWLLSLAKKRAVQWIPHPVKRIFFFGIVLTVCLMVLGKGRYCGLGTNLISASFSGEEILSYDWIIKLLLTVFTLAIGFQGGEVTPLFSMGASLGVALSGFFGMPVAFTAALGYATVFGSATNTIFAPILIGCEVFGFSMAPFFLVVCLMAHLFSPFASIYGRQKRLKWKEQWKGLFSGEDL
ncbi:chloride channel protein [Anaerotignum lactatifermentans]|uniref:Chloride channel protein n=2 Tax=Anaerotignum lactatifermentans TaxID=160404 RepID=A0ABS2G963_9FIRM|nr:chloride channel protein [Anaerotignum lactatifermentans]MBM6877974.1 chloride channel protein [Anaerotignum lactatifermentans]MBM6950149.1 chloride channel protein [Anaerotignum lactatifermentans]